MAWKGTRKEFINKYGSYIHKITKGTGILPGTLIAQAFIESSSGKTPSIVGSSGLTQKTNNYFGVKCGGNWSGPCYSTDTGEFFNGNYTVIKDSFRKYGSIEESIKDYINFLQTNQRYTTAGVFLAKNVKDQAKALKAAGYATAPGYADFVYNVYKPYAKLIDEQKTAGFSFKTVAAALLFAIAATALSKYIKK
jgi:N-acetylmuramoyl-L-alanine amidase